MKGVWGSGCIDPHFLTLALAGSEWSASHSCCFNPGKEPPVPIGQENGLAPELVWTMRRENSWPYWALSSDPSIVQPVASHYTDCAILASSIRLDRIKSEVIYMVETKYSLMKQKNRWRVLYSGMWLHIVCLHLHCQIVSQTSKTSIKQLACCLAYTSTLKMEAVHSFNTYINFYQTTWSHIPRDNTVHIDCHKNLKHKIDDYREKWLIHPIKRDAKTPKPRPSAQTERLHRYRKTIQNTAMNSE
jgi:hypothetical protein